MASQNNSNRRNYDRFSNIEELETFMSTQCGQCDLRPNCNHYSHLQTSLDTRFTRRHWSLDFFARDSEGVPYCNKGKN